MWVVLVLGAKVPGYSRRQLPQANLDLDFLSKNPTFFTDRFKFKSQQDEFELGIRPLLGRVGQGRTVL